MKSGKNNRPRLTGEYVRDFYNNTLGGMDMPYSDFRWFSSSFSIAEYNQTKKAVLSTLGNKDFNSVLEIGGGDGAWTELLIERSGHITELDISEEMIARAKERFGGRGNINFVCTDFLENNLSSNKYDLIYAARCFEYFPDKGKAVSEIHRLLKSGGEVLIVTKNPHYITLKKGEKKTLHRGQISSQDLKYLLVSVGFVIKDIKPAILGKKFDIMPARILFNALHAISLSRAGFLVPGVMEKYFSESYLVLAQRP